MTFTSWSLPFKYFALSGLEKNDLSFAKVYIRLKEKPEDELDERIFSCKMEAAQEPIGVRVFPMACAAVYRRKSWMAIAKGFSRYLWGTEIYEQNNLYGRYLAYGTLEIICENGMSGFSHDGYDWSRIPGATAIRLPLHSMKAKLQNPDCFSGVEEMLISDQSFAGGNSLDRYTADRIIKLNNYPESIGGKGYYR